MLGRIAAVHSSDTSGKTNSACNSPVTAPTSSCDIRSRLALGPLHTLLRLTCALPFCLLSQQHVGTIFSRVAPGATCKARQIAVARVLAIESSLLGLFSALCHSVRRL